MSGPASRGKQWLFAAVAVFLGLAVVELGLRLAGFRPLPTRAVTSNPEILAQYTKFRASPDLVWELVPGWTGREGAGTVRINSHGLRERELPIARPPGVRRILCIGDSVTFGHWVEAEEAYPRRLEQILALAGGSRLEVVNAGVPGYSPFQEAAWLSSRGWAYGPDMVVVGLVLNDVVERYLTLAAYGGANTVLGVDTTVMLDPLRRLLRRTALHRFVAFLLQARERRRETYSVRRLFDPAPSPAVEKAWRETESDLAAMADDARAHGVPLLLVVFPFRFQIAENLPPLPQRRLSAWATRHRVEFLDLTGVFQGLGAKAGFLDHDHPTPAGHLEAARAIADTMRRRHLLGGGGPPAPLGENAETMP